MERNPVPTAHEAGRTQETVWNGGIKSRAHTKKQPPNRSGRSESLYPRHEGVEVEWRVDSDLSTRRTSVVNFTPWLL